MSDIVLINLTPCEIFSNVDNPEELIKVTEIIELIQNIFQGKLESFQSTIQRNVNELPELICRHISTAYNFKNLEFFFKHLIKWTFECRNDLHFNVAIILLSKLCCSMDNPTNAWRIVYFEILNVKEISNLFTDERHNDKLLIIIDLFKQAIFTVGYKTRRDILKRLFEIIPTKDNDIYSMNCLKSIHEWIRVCLTDEGTIPYLMVHEISQYAYKSKDGLFIIFKLL
ncbi:hypothetical protein GJ496_001187 [Pomphorhynchus laevis]|nr:hypothetical protein GJ496_001187 [Pomphorhynchus laevis]